MARMKNAHAFKAFRTTVTTSGTPVQMAANEVPDGVAVVIRALRTNTGVITVGDFSANALNTSTDNFQLLQGQSISLQIDNTDRIWIDSTVNGEQTETVFEF